MNGTPYMRTDTFNPNTLGQEPAPMGTDGTRYIPSLTKLTYLGPTAHSELIAILVILLKAEAEEAAGSFTVAQNHSTLVPSWIHVIANNGLIPP